MESINTYGESHLLFPSGEWEGFYTYSWSKQRHMMTSHMNFKNGKVIGGGIDDIATFNWQGVYDTKELLCTLIKFYATHTVLYRGYVDENGIWGTWIIDDHFTGGFHIWPKLTAKENESEEVSQLCIQMDQVIFIG